jgi:hypothetical protein
MVYDRLPTLYKEHLEFLRRRLNDFVPLRFPALQLAAPEKLLWMLCFGFVSGHDFSRAVEE